MKSYKPKRREHGSFEEDGSHISKHFIKEAKNQLELSGKDFLSQLLGISSPSEEAAMQEPQEDLSSEKSQPSEKGVIFHAVKKSRSESDPGIEYFGIERDKIIKSSEIASSKEKNENIQQVKEIMVELKNLVASTEVLQSQFGQITVENAPVNPGKYYLNFFEWLLFMIKQARQKVEDSKAWLYTVNSKSKKNSYWGKSKKYGTSFSQANERYVATSTG